MSKQFLFSITKKDFTVQTFCSGGKGGQHQNKTSSGVRIIHNESGATGECRNTRSQAQNKKIAFQRLTESNKFKIWLNKKIFFIDKSEEELQKTVDNDMLPKNLLIEAIINEKWEKIKNETI